MFLSECLPNGTYIYNGVTNTTTKLSMSIIFVATVDRDKFSGQYQTRIYSGFFVEK